MAGHPNGNRVDDKYPSSNSRDAIPSLTKSVWLNAWNDPVAGVRAYSPCVHSCNLFGDGENRLVVADEDRKLKVWRGTVKASEHALLDTPVAITSFISESTGPRPLPSLAVAAGSHVFIYRNLRPYYKFVLPPENVNTEEQEIWTKVMGGDTVIGDAVAELTRLQDAGVILTTRSLQIMNMGDPEKKKVFVEDWQGQQLVATTVITCMDIIKQAVDEPDAVSCLVIGTESGRVLILNSAGTAIAKNMWLGVTPAFMAVQGELEGGYKITVAARDGKVYTIRNGEVHQTIIQLEAPAVGLVRNGKNFVVGCMNNIVHSYQHSGHKNYSLFLPCSILSMQALEANNQRQTKCVMLALSNGEVRVYNDKSLVSVHTVPSPVTAMWFGRYGREDNTLVTVTKGGMLDFKMLPRSANLEVGPPAGPPPEQDIPLQVPKKTRLYVEQTQREREQAASMHRVFQRDLAKLRLTTARAYVKVLTDGQGAAAFTSSASLSLHVNAQGLGPRFKLVMTLRNDGARQYSNLPVLLKTNERMYALSKKLLLVPLLVPALSYVLEVDVQCLLPEAGSDTISVLLLSANSSLPILQAKVKMPLSELDNDS